MKTLTPLFQPPAKHYENHTKDIDILARTLWGEARGEGTTGMQAVANVVMNRVQIAKGNPTYWWGHDVKTVCLKDWQFSCWNADDPNRRKIIELTDRDLYFATALRLARRAVYNKLEDITEGATHYHAAGISPYWAKGVKPVFVLGHHIFYKLV